jgi:hypothetical protein
MFCEPVAMPFVLSVSPALFWGKQSKDAQAPQVLLGGFFDLLTGLLDVLARTLDSVAGGERKGENGGDQDQQQGT